MNFPERDKSKALTKFHHDSGQLIEGMDILLERNYRTPLIPAKLISWNIGEVINDITGYGKYSVSNCMVEFDGQQVSWPFSMIYVA
jgi:hypothetical protein